MNAFLAQGADLFRFVWEYRFVEEIDGEARLVLFLQLASQYDEELRYTSEVQTMNHIEYPIIYPK